jgi:hypothetical protein
MANQLMAYISTTSLLTLACSILAPALPMQDPYIIIAMHNLDYFPHHDLLLTGKCSRWNALDVYVRLLIVLYAGMQLTHAADVVMGRLKKHSAPTH